MKKHLPHYIIILFTIINLLPLLANIFIYEKFTTDKTKASIYCYIVRDWDDECLPQGVIDPMQFGAKCDATTDDTNAFQLSLDRLSSTKFRYTSIVVPGICRIGHLYYKSTEIKPLVLFGHGPRSQLILYDATGGITIRGSCGIRSEHVYLSDFSIKSDAIPDIAFGIELDGVAVYGLSNVSFANSEHIVNIGIVGRGAQQGYIHGGYSFSTNIDVSLDDCIGEAGVISSNGISYGLGRTSQSTIATANITGGASDVWLTGIHHTGGKHSVIVNQTSGAGGRGPIYIRDSHFESDNEAAIYVESGTVYAQSINCFNKHFLVSSGNSVVNLSNSLINGDIEFLDSSNGSIFNSIINGKILNKSTHELELYNNKGNGNTSDSIHISGIYHVASTSRAPRDIATFKANAAVSGPWGISIEGAGLDQPIYIRLGQITIAGNTSGNKLSFQFGSGSPHAVEVGQGGVSAFRYIGVGAPPRIVDCGNGAAVEGNDTSGKIRIGTEAPSDCRILFARPFAGKVTCVVTQSDPLSDKHYGVSNIGGVGFVLKLRGDYGSSTFNYMCLGEQ